MMSAVGGGGGTLVADNSADQLRECDSDMGGRGQEIRKCRRRLIQIIPKNKSAMAL